METTRAYAIDMKRFVVIVAAAFMLAACGRTADESSVTQSGVDVDAHRAEIAQWQQRRIEGLKKEDSWLTLVGLHWLREGENRFGSDESRNSAVLPATAPPVAGAVILRDGKIILEPAAPMTIDGRAVTGQVELLHDANEGGPTIVQMGSIRFQAIKRGDRYALRVKDAEAETRTEFAGLEYFPVDPKWRVEARFEPYEPPKKIPIQDVTGMTAENISPGALVFTVDGREYRLDPVLEDDRLFIIFKDETSRDSTYPAGRYVYADKPGADGKVIVDFNRAYNPPCAFTDFATCPLPPPQNVLPVRIEAGEKRYAGGH